MKQIVTIIGGKYRGKKLYFPNIDNLRPTPNRVRETLFNWLMHDIQEACCLDAYAGSGALGFEAFSRGAKHVVFVETARQAYTQLCHLASSFNSKALTLIYDHAEHYIQETKLCFDIIFLDPPFALGNPSQYLELFAHTPCLKAGGLVYLESSQEPFFNTQHWRQKKSKQAGQVVYGLYEKIE